jgi:hypothetical protein
VRLITLGVGVARAARRHRIKRLVFAHIGRPTLRELAAGLRPPFGEFATDGQAFAGAAANLKAGRPGTSARPGRIASRGEALATLVSTAGASGIRNAFEVGPEAREL